ncbi:hypothetical protein V6N13_031365 [Hibiscus sabdariffa]
MQQHLMQIQPTVAAYYPNNVTTDHIQQPGGGHYMPHQQAQPMTQQSLMASRAPALYAQQPFSALQQQQQQQQAVHSQVGLSSGILQSEASSASGSGALAARGFPDFVRVSSAEGMHGGGSRAMAGGSKQDSGSAVGSPEDQCDDEN